eukprot:1351293-Pleurochrysis_carterae.AAC.1
MPPTSPQSAGFSTIHGVPAPCAAVTKRAAKSARALCFRMYAAHCAGIGATPPGCWRVRIAGGRARRRTRSRGRARRSPQTARPSPRRGGCRLPRRARRRGRAPPTL